MPCSSTCCCRGQLCALHGRLPGSPPGDRVCCALRRRIVSHLMLPFSRISWRLKGLLSLSAAIIVAGVVFVGFRLFGLELPRRPFDLERANLSNHWLPKGNFRGAKLFGANLSGAVLRAANLRGAAA